MNRSVLVVDDDQLLLRLLEINLNKVGCQVLMALDGPTALRIASEEAPALILLDLMMPRMDGWEVMRQLKDSESTRDIPVIIVTGKVDPGTRSRILELGARRLRGQALRRHRVAQDDQGDARLQQLILLAPFPAGFPVL